MDGQIYAPVEKGAVQLFGKDRLVPDLRDGRVCRLVAARRDGLQLNAVPGGFELRPHDIGLPEGQLTASSAENERIGNRHAQSRGSSEENASDAPHIHDTAPSSRTVHNRDAGRRARLTGRGPPRDARRPGARPIGEGPSALPLFPSRRLPDRGSCRDSGTGPRPGRASRCRTLPPGPVPRRSRRTARTARGVARCPGRSRCSPGRRF